MLRRTLATFFAAVLLGLVFLSAGDAWAEPNDDEAETLVESVFASDYAEGNFGDSLEKLQLAADACEDGGCSGPVHAKVWVGVGTVLAGGLGDVEAARVAFVEALKKDPNAKLLPKFSDEKVKQAFNEARAKAGTSGAGVEEADEVCPAYDGATTTGAGFNSPESFHYYQKALEREDGRNWKGCYVCAQESVKRENRATTRFLAASCAERAGMWLEAIGDYEIVAETAGRFGLHDVAEKATERGAELTEKIPRVILRPPTEARDLQVKMNNKKIAADKLSGEIWVNPGEIGVSASGLIGGEELYFEQVIDAAEYETVTVDIRLVPKDETITNALIMKCMARSKSKEEFAACIQAGGGSSLNVLIGLEMSGYHDTDSVDVLSPAIYTSITSPTSGWSVGGGFLVDVVTAASADIVATASPRWTEVRYVPSLNGSYKLSDVTVGVNGNLSIEPDYTAAGVGASLSTDLFDKRVTPSLGYDFGYDLSGRSGTGFDAFSETITRHGINAGVSVVIDKASVIGFSFTGVFEDGDLSKPYRYVPMFAIENVPLVPPGFAVEGVNNERQPERVIEQLPLDRQRYAVAVQYAHRYTESTLRLEERLYGDSWGVKASTTDGRFIVDLGERVRVWPHGRFHIQTGADFWQLAYASRRTPQGLEVPALRTGDRELGPLYSATGGGGIFLGLGEEKNWGLSFSADVVFSRFLNHLFLIQRFGYFGALGLEVEL